MPRKSLGVAQPSEQVVEVPFPSEGLDESRRFHTAHRRHTPRAQNVRAYEKGTDRLRGSSRAGLRKYLSSQINGSASIQDINHLISTQLNPTAGYGQIAMGRRTSAGTGSFNLLSATAGAVYATLGTAAAEPNACCWDAETNFYFAERNTTTHAITIRKVDVDGDALWSRDAFTVDGADLGVFGLVVVDGILYAYATRFSGQSRLYRFDIVTGADHGVNPWKTESADSLVDLGGIGLGAHSFNVLAEGQGVLGICGGTDGNTVKLQLWNINAGTIIATVTVSSDGSGTEARGFASDGLGNFYVSFQDSGSGRVYKYNSAGTSQWTQDVATAQGIAVDRVNQRGALVGANVYNQAHSFATFLLTTGARVASQDAGSTNDWDFVAADGSGGFVLFRDNGTNIEYMRLTSALAQDWIVTGNSSLFDPPRFLAVNDGQSSALVENLTVREIRSVAVAGGTVKVFDSEGTTAVTSGTIALSVGAPVIFSTQFGDDLYYADGVNAKLYDTSANAVVAWTPTAGSLPVDSRGHRPKLICTWRARVVLAGLRYDAQNWFMSAVNDALDFDYAPATTTATQAVAGNNSPAGQVGDIINCLLPYTDDVLLFGGDHTIWALSGDPMAGGQIDLVTDAVGMAWGRPYCMDPQGAIYFFSSRGAVYRMMPGAKPLRISQQINNRLAQVDVGATVVRMVWDDRCQGFHLFLTPLGRTAQATHFFWDSRQNGWWPDVFGDRDFNPRAVHLFDGDDPSDRVVLLGSWDGYIRQFHEDQDTDDGKPFTSTVVLGPVTSTQLDEFLLKDLQAVLSDGAGEVEWSIRVGDTAETALDSSTAAVADGTWTAGRNPLSLVRRSGHAVTVQLSSTSGWALEVLRARLTTLGKTRRRGV